MLFHSLFSFNGVLIIIFFIFKEVLELVRDLPLPHLIDFTFLDESFSGPVREKEVPKILKDMLRGCPRVQNVVVGSVVENDEIASDVSADWPYMCGWSWWVRSDMEEDADDPWWKTWGVANGTYHNASLRWYRRYQREYEVDPMYSVA